MKLHHAQSPADADLLAPLFDRYRLFYGMKGDLEGARKFLRERLAQGDAVLLWIELDGQPAGFAQMYPSFSSLAMRTAWILNDLFVEENFRRRNVGETLLKEAENFARQRGARGITLKTARDNTQAQSLYQKLGWVRDDRFYSFDRRLD